jgi:hypothetical protein
MSRSGHFLDTWLKMSFSGGVGVDELFRNLKQIFNWLGG